MKSKTLNKKLFKIGTVFLIIVCSFSLIFAFPVSALTTYYMTYDKPSADDYSGYMEVLLSDGGVITFFFKIVSFGTNIKYLPYGEVYVTSSSLSVKFYIGGSSGEVGQANVHLVDGFMATSGYNYIHHSELYEDYTLNCYIQSGLTVKQVKLYGFLQPSYSSSSFVNGVSDWVVSYGSNYTISNQLNTIIGSLQQQNNDIIANADKNADEIQANADKNTNEITQGGKDYDSIDDSTANDFSNAEQEALGGKTDTQIQAEVNDALNGGSSGLDFTKANKISNFFNNCMSSFGIETLVLFSLCMGLGAFIIGRRYG